MLDFNELNFIAIIGGTLLYMIYGTIYYSILLGKIKASDDQSEGPIKYIVSIIVAFISSLLVAILVQATASEGLFEGAAVGIIIGMLISIVYLKNSLFGLMSRNSFLIAIGDHLIIFTLLGALHGLFV
ncbi:DUF1761 domain-containing protein [Bacillus sp. PAMC26568]|nr:DUF1761 domain-containing protein [Bacillus sp. PAMC26568]